MRRKLRPDPAAERARRERVCKRFGAVVALDGVSLEVRARRVRRADRRERLGQDDAAALLQPTDRARRGRSAGRTARTWRRWTPSSCGGASATCPQDGGLLPHWRVRRNVALVPWLRGDAATRPRLPSARCELVGLEPDAFGDRWPRELSGGQRQRVALARALAAGPGRAPPRRAVRRARRDHPRRPAGRLPRASAASSRSPRCS